MKILIVGFGSVGRRHFQNLLSLGETDLIFLRSHQSTLDDNELEGFQIETDLDAALAHQPDGVIIANPTAFHLDVAIPAARKGCHLLLEKPISNSMDRIDELVEALNESGARVLVGFQFRHHPGLLQIKDWLNNETIGQIHYVRAHCGEYLPGWHPWEDYKKGYSAKKELGGGVLLTLSHPIDYLSWLFGDVKSVSGIFSPGGALGIDVEECIDAAFNFENGIIGSLHLDYLQRPPEHILKIIGSSGTIVWDYDGDLRINKANIGSWETHTLPEGFSRNDLFLTEMKNFLGVIEGDEPLCSLREGIQVQKIIQAIYQAAETGQVVPV